MKGSSDIYNRITEYTASFMYDFNRSVHEDFPELIVGFITELKDLLELDKILVIQPLIMDDRLESFVSGPGKDYSSLDKMREMNRSERMVVLNSIDELCEYSESTGKTFPFFDESDFRQVIASPIKNLQTVSEVNGGVFFMNRKEKFDMDEYIRKGIIIASECITSIFNSYRKNQMYIINYKIFQGMQESQRNAVCIYSWRGVVVFLNKYFAELVGKGEEDILSRDIKDVLKLENHETKQDYHSYSEDPDPNLPEEPGAMYCKQIKEDGKKVPLRKYCSRISIEKNNYWILVLQDMTTELKNMDVLRKSGQKDLLTGLGNRRRFEKDLSDLLNKDKLPVAVIVGDVNGLKLMNDIFGHDYGDHLLKKISGILENNCENGSVYRMGGDEFHIFLNNTNEIEAKEIIGKINDDCSREFKDLNFIGISLGCSIVKDADTKVGTVIRKAESDMYYIKSMSSEHIKNESIKSLKRMNQKKYSSEKERTERLVDIAGEFAPYLNFRDSELDDIRSSIELIDIGKVSVSQFMPEGNLVSSDDEFENMKKHCWIGYKIAALSYETSHLARVILNHHENWDGSGFPQGIKGNAIPFLSRVIRILAYYDNLVIRNKMLEQENIIMELETRKGKLFDPAITDSFVTYLRSKSIG